MIVADTTLWLQHVRTGHAQLAELLSQGRVAMHPAVLGELACCSLDRRDRLLSLLRELPQVPACDDEIVLRFVDRHRLHGLGLGLVDVQLLAAVHLQEGLSLWTDVACLRAAALALGCGYPVDDIHHGSFFAPLPSLPIEMNSSALGRG